MPAAQGTAVCGPAARLLGEALAKETTDDAFWTQADGLSALAGRLPPADAVRLLAEALSQQTDADACRLLAQGLVIVADRVEAGEADRVCERALALMQQREAGATAWEARMKFRDAASVVLQPLAEEKARGIALQRARQTAAAADVNRADSHFELSQVVTLDRLLSGGTLSQQRRGAVATATVVGLACGGPTPAFAILPSAAEPLPCRLTTPQLVELLKYPTCIAPPARSSSSTSATATAAPSPITGNSSATPKITTSVSTSPAPQSVPSRSRRMTGQSRAAGIADPFVQKDELPTPAA
ncbi:MAG TPA: hypothetical protein VFW33_18000 [Gemmataceae bacterium]|nr:hypothetical protein [Gemmataceae bacterium]